MKPPVPLERAEAMIQDWYYQYCKAYEKPLIQLDSKEEDEKVSGLKLHFFAYAEEVKIFDQKMWEFPTPLLEIPTFG